ncbi:MAG: thiamine phosphate synthase, partial [Chloroflexi bacterium]|nr:thiamine phosphate synthase [Chloroflexota bacterium]
MKVTTALDLGLYVVTDRALARGRSHQEVAAAAFAGGANVVQLRDKTLEARELCEVAQEIQSIATRARALLIINDRVDVALAVGADGVHLGQDDLSIAAARRVLSAAQIIGVSTHSLEQVESASTAAPDYIAVGPMFATPTKPQERIAGPATRATARRHTSLPLVAIGGIDDRNAPAVLAAAPCALCV